MRQLQRMLRILRPAAQPRHGWNDLSAQPQAMENNDIIWARLMRELSIMLMPGNLLQVLLQFQSPMIPSKKSSTASLLWPILDLHIALSLDMCAAPGQRPIFLAMRCDSDLTHPA